MEAKQVPRAEFIKFLASSALLIAPGIKPLIKYISSTSMDLKLSLSQWALHRAIFGNSKDNYPEWKRLLHSDPDKLWQGDMHPLDFPAKARALGFNAVEYVNSLIFGHAQDKQFLDDLKGRTDSEGIQNLLIMVDEEGFIGHPDSKERGAAIENHFKWMEAARHLGCHSIRVNAFSKGKPEEQKKLASEGLRKLAEKAEEFDLNILIENHGGMSSNADWLADTIKLADHKLLGTMVDFDNFIYSDEFIWGDGEIYDRYEGVEKLMPFAKSVSAKSYDFDDEGNETTIDFEKMIKIIEQSGFNGHISVEYEGHRLGEEEGIIATKQLLEKQF